MKGLTSFSSLVIYIIQRKTGGGWVGSFPLYVHSLTLRMSWAWTIEHQFQQFQKTKPNCVASVQLLQFCRQPFWINCGWVFRWVSCWDNCWVIWLLTRRIFMLGNKATFTDEANIRKLLVWGQETNQRIWGIIEDMVTQECFGKALKLAHQKEKSTPIKTPASGMFGNQTKLSDYLVAADICLAAILNKLKLGFGENNFWGCLLTFCAFQN